MDANPKAIQQTEFVGQLKKLHDNGDASEVGDGTQSLFVLMIFLKKKNNQRNTTKILSRKWNSFIKDGQL